MIVRMLIEQPALLYSVLCAIICALVSDVVYIYPIFGPPLSNEFGYTKLQSNVAAAMSNVGLFLMEPIMGDIIDRKGPQGICLLGIGLFASSFYGLITLYNGNFQETYILTIMFLFMMGAGSAAVEEAAFSTIARNFPSRVRGTMLGLLYMFFCLSGLFYSWINSQWFAGTADVHNDIYRFLITTGLLTTLVPLVLVPGLRWLPGADDILEEELIADSQSEGGRTPSGCSSIVKKQSDEDTITSYSHTNNSKVRNFENESNSETHLSEKAPLIASHEHDYDDYLSHDNELIQSEDLIGSHTSSSSSLVELLCDLDFWFFWMAICLVVGTDLMFVNNLGHVIEQLWIGSMGEREKWPANNNANYIQLVLNKSMMIDSVASCIAGLSVGYISDWCKEHLNMDRVYFFIVAALIQSSALLALSQINSIAWLYWATGFSGIASGAIFTVISVVVSDYWGTEHCGRNVGLLGWAIALGSQLFGAMFGAIFDARKEHPNGCTGRLCYRDGFYVATVACIIGAILSVIIYYRRRHLIA
ncbi:major facilitator superfamily domain-containing protein [Syncephalis fuscata]|nr:major facilitator superfamily domain-containing protein [Syncephalis fuscata]